MHPERRALQMAQALFDLDEVRVIRDQIEARVQELARDRIDAIREDRRQHRRAREIMKARSGAAVA